MEARAIIVHSLAQAGAAVAAAGELGVPLTLASPRGAAGYLGALWFRELIVAATAARPDVEVRAILDCGDAPGHVLSALRQGLKEVRFTGRAETAKTLQQIADAYGAQVLTGALPAHDLVDVEDPEAACRRWLSGA